MLLRRLRREREMTQAQLARRVGLKTTQISSIESGSRNPSLDKAREIAAVFGLPIEQVFGYVEVPA